MILERIGLDAQALARGIVEDMTAVVADLVGDRLRS